MDDWITEYRSELLGEDNIRAQTLARIVQRADDVDERDVELARQLTSSDVSYLLNWQISWLIEAELSEQEAILSASKNRAIFEKFADLLPSILIQLSNKSNYSLRYAIHRIFENAYEFSLEPTDNRRLDKIRNDRLRMLLKSRVAFNQAISVLRELEGEIPEYGREFAQQFWSKNGEFSAVERTRDPIYLIELLSMASVASEIVSHDIGSKHPREHLRSQRKSKSDIVALAYDLHIQCGGPPLVTTPGSDFSILCSLIYELATGKAEESLAGAIIDFARGRARRDEDDYQNEVKRDEEAYASGDNFHLLKAGSVSDRVSAIWYSEASRSFPVESPVRHALISTAEALNQRATDREKSLGPFLVWAEHIPEVRRGDKIHELREMRENLRQARIEIGRLKRLAAALG